MSKLDIRSIRRKYLKLKKSDEVLKGCFHKEDIKKYHILEDLINVKGYAYLTIEKSKGRFIKVYTIKVNEVRAIRGSAFFIYEHENGDKELIFEYHKSEDNIRIGVDPKQKPYKFEYYNYPQNVSYEELYDMTERLVYKHYDDIYHLWMLQDDVDKFASKLDLNLPSRLRLHKIRLEFCQKQYVEKYGFEGARINELLNELENDPREYLGYKTYARYLAEDNPITLKE